MKQETGIKRAILNLLTYYENKGQVYVISNNSFAGFVQRYNGSKGYIKNNKPGTPDIVCCINGMFIGLECKTSTGKQSSDQKLAQQAIEKAGGKYFIVRDVFEADKIIKHILRIDPSDSK